MTEDRTDLGREVEAALREVLAHTRGEVALPPRTIDEPSREGIVAVRARAPGRRAPERFDLLQVVYLRDARPDLGLARGERGTVVEVFDRPHRAYYVEFVADDGVTKTEGAFTPDQLSATPPAP